MGGVVGVVAVPSEGLVTEEGSVLVHVLGEVVGLLEEAVGLADRVWGPGRWAPVPWRDVVGRVFRSGDARDPVVVPGSVARTLRWFHGDAWVVCVAVGEVGAWVEVWPLDGGLLGGLRIRRLPNPVFWV